VTGESRALTRLVCMSAGDFSRLCTQVPQADTTGSVSAASLEHSRPSAVRARAWRERRHARPGADAARREADAASAVQGDLELARDARSGDGGSTTRLVARLGCVALFLNTQNRRFGGMFDVEALRDLGQECQAIAWSKLDEYEGRGPLEAWVFRICVLQFMNAVRRRARRGTTSIDAYELELPAAGAPSDLAAGDLLPLRVALCALSEVEQRVVRMRHYEQLGFAEIAAELALPVNTAKSHYHRALLRLRERLRRAYAEEEG
jgi:RNA polymerase sigma-70 factor (ECF subfamily)